MKRAYRQTLLPSKGLKYLTSVSHENCRGDVELEVLVTGKRCGPRTHYLANYVR